MGRRVRQQERCGREHHDPDSHRRLPLRRRRVWWIVQDRIPAKTQSTNGQSLTVSANSGKWGFFASGARQATDMRREPVVFDTLRNAVENFHNDGTDLFGFAKVQYVPSNRDVVSLDVNRSRTRFAVPFDSVEGIIDDHQQDVNGFANLGWRHRFGEAAAVEAGSSELFAGVFFRDGSLTYTPGPTDEPSFIFYPDTTPYNLSEDRDFHTLGVKVDYL